jgi:hypothetical protein
VIGAFLDSWPLFQTTYLTGWLIAFVLSLVGVWVVARDQIFLGVAVAQASTLGIATALFLAEMSAAGALGCTRRRWRPRCRWRPRWPPRSSPRVPPAAAPRPPRR